MASKYLIDSIMLLRRVSSAFFLAYMLRGDPVSRFDLEWYLLAKWHLFDELGSDVIHLNNDRRRNE